MLECPLSRRQFVVAGAIGGFASVAGVAAPSSAGSIFAHTPLADNALARNFIPLPASVRVPSTPLQTADGARPLSSLTRPATLVTFWAEFCAPCLMEMPDLAALRRRYVAAGFDVVAVHVGSNPQAARQKLASIGVHDIASWNDPDAHVVTALATPPGEKGFTMPCNLLIDRHGRVRARAFGAQAATSFHTASSTLTDADKRRIMLLKSKWALPIGDQFASALASGLLDRV